MIFNRPFLFVNKVTKWLLSFLWWQKMPLQNNLFPFLAPKKSSPPPLKQPKNLVFSSMISISHQIQFSVIPRGYQSNRIEVRLAILIADLIEFNRITGIRLVELIERQSNRPFCKRSNPFDLLQYSLF